MKRNFIKTNLKTEDIKLKIIEKVNEAKQNERLIPYNTNRIK